MKTIILLINMFGALILANVIYADYSSTFMMNCLTLLLLSATLFLAFWAFEALSIVLVREIVYEIKSSKEKRVK